MINNLKCFNIEYIFATIPAALSIYYDLFLYISSPQEVCSLFLCPST